MDWVKLGRLLEINNFSELASSHCMTSFVMPLAQDMFRIYFNSRDSNGHSRPFYAEFSIKAPQSTIKFCEKPLMKLGEYGSFDEAGMVFTSYCHVGDDIWFYYSGFPRTAKQIFQAYTGIAVSHDGGKTAERMFEGPVIGLNRFEPYWAAGPRVYKQGDTFVLYYTSSEGWKEKQGNIVHMYNIKRSESLDGINWSPGVKAIDFKNQYEYAIAIPSVIVENGFYKMWYTFRAQEKIKSYRIGYAESEDGIHWNRLDERMSGFDVSPGEWDSEMLCFPYVFEYEGQKYMSYNGNDFGKNGVGLAKLV